MLWLLPRYPLHLPLLFAAAVHCGWDQPLKPVLPCPYFSVRVIPSLLSQVWDGLVTMHLRIWEWSGSETPLQANVACKCKG